MEEIEYLEEYEDLVLPALNSAAAAASSTVTSGQTKSHKISENRKVNDNGGDDSSSSLDQDIFNCLFDDNSDEDDDIEDYNIAYAEQGGELLGQEQKKNKINTFDKQTSNITTSTPKPKTFTTKTSNTTTITINRAQSTIVNKPKSIATVRPTVQNQLYQSKQKKTNTIQQRTTTSLGQQQHQQRPTTSKAAVASTTSTRAVQLPVLARKPLSSATASTSALVNKTNTQPGTSIKPTSGTLKVVKRPATIVKPEKIITKDPVNDPLNLDDLSEAGSDNYSLSDISGETYNTISEFYEEDSNDEYYSGENNEYEDDDDDNISSSSQVIELSNDSSGSRPKLEDLHASTPSPVISDDSDTANNTFDLKLRKECTTKPYSHAVIIQSVLRKGEKPKLLELLKQYNLIDDDSTVDNDHEEEANVVIDISTSKGNLSESLETKTVKSKTPDIVENSNKPESNPSTAFLPTSSANKDKNKSNKKRLKNMDNSNANRDSTDSDLSAVEELLEESYAEAMKRLKTNQDVVGAELEIAGEEEVTAIEFVKNPEVNKPKLNKPGIVIDYEDNPVEEKESTKDNEGNEMTMEKLIEMIEKEQKEKKLKKAGKLREKPLNRENANTPERNSQSKSKEIVKNEPHTSKEITTNTDSSCSPQKEIMTETLTSKEVTDKPESSCFKQKDIVEDNTNVPIDVTDKPDINTLESNPNDKESVSTDSPNVRKKKRFRNLNTPEPDIVKSVDDMNDFIGFDDGAKPIEFSSVPFVENVTTQEKELETKVVEQSNKKPMEITSKTTTKAEDSSGSFKSPTSSHKSLQDKHKETKDKHSRDISKESKPLSLSRESSKEKSSRENSKDSSSRESSKDRSRESSKDQTKSLHVKDSDKKYYIEHRKSNDSKESSRSRESSKSRDSKHSSDKKDNAADKTKSSGSTDGKNRKDNEIKKKEFKVDRSSTEKKGDTVQYKKDTGDLNKKIPSTSAKDSSNLDKVKKESKDSTKFFSKSSASSSSTSRDSSKDRKDIKKQAESSNKSIGESKKAEIIKKSTDSFDKNKSVKAVTASGTNVESKKSSISSTKVSNSNEKHADKFKSTSKSVVDSKSDKSYIKSSKDSNNASKVTPTKTTDSKSSALKNIKDNSMVKNTTPSSSKTITQSPDIKAIKDKSNTSLKVATQNISEAKSKDSNSRYIKVDSKSTTKNPDKSTTFGANKTSKNVAEDKKVVQKGDVANKNATSKPTDKVVDQNNKTSVADGANKAISKIADSNTKSSSVVNKSLNKIEEPNKKSSPLDANKSKNIIEQKKEPSNKQSSSDGSKDMKTIPGNKLTEEVSGNNLNIKKQKVVVTLNDDVNKSKESPSKLINKKPIESTQREKSGDICKKDDLRKQDHKTNIKTISEEQKSKETKNKAQDNKTDQSISLKPKQEFKSTSDEIKTNVDNEKSKEQPIKTRNPKTVNLSEKSQAGDVDQEAETIEKIEAAVKHTIEKSKIEQTTGTEELKQKQELSANKTAENTPGTKPKTCSNKPTKEVVKLEAKADTPMVTKQAEGKNPSKESKLEQIDASMTEENKIEAAVTASNVEIKEVEQKSIENISTKKNEIEKPKAITSKITSKPSEIIANTTEEVPKDVNVTNKFNENCTLQNTSKDAGTKEITKDVSIRKRKSKVLSPIVIGESKVNKTEAGEPMKIQQIDELIEDNKDKQDQQEKTEEIIEARVTRKHMETSKANENVADLKNSSEGYEVKVNKYEADEPTKAKKSNELIEDYKGKQDQQEKTEEIIVPRVTRKRMETSKINENIVDSKNDSQSGEVTSTTEVDIKKNEPIEENKDNQDQNEKTKEFIEPRNTRKRMETSKTNESIADSKNSSEGGEATSNTVDIKNSEPEESKLEPRITRQRVNKEISELGVEKILEENKLEMVEPIKVETKVEDEKSKISELSSNKTEKTEQTKEEEMHGIKNEDSKENRTDIKSDTKTEETQSVEYSQFEITGEKDAGSESNISIRTRKRVVAKRDADILKTCVNEKEPKGTIECAEEIAGLLKEDKTESKKKIAIEAEERDNFESKLTRKRAGAKVQESIEPSNKDKIDLKAETSDCIVETGKQTEEKNVIKAKNTYITDVESIITKKRAEEKAENLDKKRIVKSSSGVVDELNTKMEESIEPVKTRKGAEKTKTIGVEAEDHAETISLRKRVVIVNDIKQNEDAEPSNTDKNNEENQAIDEEKGRTTVMDAVKAIDNKSEPIRTRKRADVKADVIEQKESTEPKNEEKIVSKDQIKENIIEPIITRKRLEETYAVGIEKNQESTPELIRKRKRAKVKSDDSNKEERSVCESESKADQTEKQNLESAAVEDNLVEPIRTRSRMELKMDITNATVSTTDIPKKDAEPESTHSNSTLEDDEEHKAEEKNIDRIATSNAARQSKEQTSETIKNESEARIPSNDSPNTLDNTLRRTLRKRGLESPFSENDKKKHFKEPSTKIVLGRTTPKFSNKFERPSTSATATGLKRSLRSPVSDSESPITVKKTKLETPRKTTRFRNLHDDCLEEEELPVITANASVTATELDDLNVQAKEAEDQENISQSPIRFVGRETPQNKNTEPSVEKEATLTNVGGGLEKTAEKQLKVNKAIAAEKENYETEVQVEKSISQTKESSVENKTTALNNEKSLNDEKSETKKQNSQDQNKTNKTKTNTPLNKPSNLSSVLSFSDWLKTKGKSAIVDDKSKNNSVQSTSTSEMSSYNPKAKGKSKVKGKSNTKVVETVTTEKTNKRQEGTVGEENQQKQHDVKKQISQEDSLNIDTNANQPDNSSLLQTAQKQIEKAIEPPDNIDESSIRNKKRNANTKKAKTKRYKAENANSPLVNKMFDSKVTMDILKPSTPKPKIKKSETDLLIESMSKEMKDGGINDLLNPDTHVRRARLANKKNSKGSTESLNTTNSNVTAKKHTTGTTTAGTVLNKEIPEVVDFSDTAEIVSPKAEFIKSPNKRNKTQQNAIKTNKETATGIDLNVEETTVKSRKSLNAKLLLTHNKAADEALLVAKSRKSMPQIKILNAEKYSTGVAVENTSTSSQSKSRKSVPSSIKEVDKNSNQIFKAPKPIVHTVLSNLIANQENIAKLYVEDIRRLQNRNKIMLTNVLKANKCRNFKIRLNRSKVKKYLSTQNKRKNENTLETSPTCFTESSSMIQYNADLNLRLQSVVNTADLMDLTPDYNPNNVFVPQDSFMQTNVTPSTLDLDAALTMSTMTPASVAALAANQPYVSTEGLCDTMASLPVINAAADPNEHIELKNEFLDENPIDLVNEALLPDTPTLLARAQTITQAAQNALSNSITPTDIRLLTTETTANAFVPSFGVAPRVLDNKGTCMYTFLHPAKYNRNHSNVLLDYCCPNLDGPMPAIDPTRIHAQVQVPVIELPASIVLTTKVVTKADLERENSNIPAIIRRKAEKIRNNLAAHHKVATAASAVASSSAQQPTPYIPSVTATPELTLPPTINALTKQLPATTTITAKIRPTQHQDSVAQNNTISNQSTTMPSTLTTVAQAPKNMISVIPKGPPQLNQMQKSSLRSNLRRFDILLKQLVQPFDNLNFVDRQHIIESIVTSGKILPKDLDHTILLLEEYIKQTNNLSNNVNNQTSSTTASISLPPATTAMSTNSYHTTTQPVSTIQMPQLQPSPNMLAATSSANLSSSSAYCRKQLEQLHKKAVKTVQSASKTTTSSTTIKVNSPGGGSLVKSRQVPIYDTDRNIIGYQMKMVTPMAAIPAFTKSTMSTHTGTIMSTSLDSSNNKITSFSISKRPIKRPAQDSPRVFYTTPPLKTSTPKGNTRPTSVYPSLPPNKQNNSKTIAQKTQKGSVVTTLRSAAAGGSSGSTTTMATVKRVTRSTATGSKIIIVSKSNQSCEETILPDTNNQQQPEIKNEKDIEDFIG